MVRLFEILGSNLHFALHFYIGSKIQNKNGFMLVLEGVVLFKFMKN